MQGREKKECAIKLLFRHLCTLNRLPINILDLYVAATSHYARVTRMYVWQDALLTGGSHHGSSAPRSLLTPEIKWEKEKLRSKEKPNKRARWFIHAAALRTKANGRIMPLKGGELLFRVQVWSMWHILPYNVEVVRESVFRGPIGADRGAGSRVGWGARSCNEKWSKFVSWKICGWR